MIGVNYGNRRNLDDIGLECLKQSILHKCTVTLSSARSFGKKRVTFFLRM